MRFKCVSPLPLPVQGVGAFASATTWIWGIALPMSVVGIATHYLTWLRTQWSQYWRQAEQAR